MTIYHNGINIPTADPKDPDSDVWYGFTYTLEDIETISSSTWLINGTAVSNGQDVDGLTFESSSFSANVTKANLSGGNTGERYTVTNRIDTNVTPSDDRSMYITIKPL
jgi:hypothetical protein